MSIHSLLASDDSTGKDSYCNIALQVSLPGGTRGAYAQFVSHTWKHGANGPSPHLIAVLQGNYDTLYKPLELLSML